MAPMSHRNSLSLESVVVDHVMQDILPEKKCCYWTVCGRAVSWKDGTLLASSGVSVTALFASYFLQNYYALGVSALSILTTTGLGYWHLRNAETLGNFHDQNVKLDKTEDDLHITSTSVQKTVEDLKKAILEQKLIVAQLTEEKGSLEISLKKERSQFLELQNLHTELQSTNSNLGKTNVALKGQVDYLQQVLKGLKESLDIFSKNNSNFNTDLTIGEKENTKLTIETEHLDKKIQHFDELFDQDIDALGKEIHKSAELCQTLIFKLQEQYEVSKKQLEQFSGKQLQLQEVEKKIAAENEELKKLVEDVQKQKNELEDLRKEFSSLNQEFTKEREQFNKDFKEWHSLQKNLLQDNKDLSQTNNQMTTNADNMEKLAKRIENALNDS